MDCWYVVNELVVPKDQESSESFPSPENWSDWGMISDSENSVFPNKSFVHDSKWNHEELDYNSDIFSNEESCIHDKDLYSSSIGGGGGTSSGEEYLQQNAGSNDHQLDSISGFEQMDDIFFGSLVDELPGTESLPDSFCFEPEFENEMVYGDNMSRDMILNRQSIASVAHNMGSSKYLKTHAFSPSVDQGNAKIPAPLHNSCNLGQKHCIPKVKVQSPNVRFPSEHNKVNDDVGEERSIEESVLQQLELVMTQLTDKTRIYFRDALYRLAKNSREHVVTQNQIGDVSMGTSPWTCQQEKLRPEGRKAMESETNSIDRAIANLMFNKADKNVLDEPCSAAPTKPGFPRQEATKPLYYKPEIQSSFRYPVFISDAEVPNFC